jgi:hypothetical protein
MLYSQFYNLKAVVNQDREAQHQAYAYQATEECFRHYQYWQPPACQTLSLASPQYHCAKVYYLQLVVSEFFSTGFLMDQFIF